MISQVMSLKSQQDRLGLEKEQTQQQRINDYINNIYKLGLLEAQINPPKKESVLEPIFVKDVPGYGDLTLDGYKALPTEDRLYVTHILSARQRGEKPLTREEFDAITDKDRHPASAEAAAIDQLYNEFNGYPPQDKIKEIHDLYNPPKDSEPEPALMSQLNATQELTKRFGRLDPTGMWTVTPELQSRQ